MISSKVFERWLISITDMPTPGSASRSLCASSKTGSGMIAGPALKLKIRSVMMSFVLCSLCFASSTEYAVFTRPLPPAVLTCRLPTAYCLLLTAYCVAQHRSRRAQNKRSRYQTFSLDHKEVRPTRNNVALGALETTQRRLDYLFR